MAPVRPSLLLVALAVFGGCYQPQSAGYTTYPQYIEVAGPPGGAMDSSWQYQQYPGYPDGYTNGYPAGTEDVAAMQTEAASSDPMAAGYAMGATTDAEIAATLDPYGEWVWIESYGYVWRPNTTAVGLDFTPYESCGSWVWTDDWGWTFACEWDWGWLPFHYGRWGWFEDYWAWQPGYEWSAGWVDWRAGDDTCGWRPQSPVSGYWDNGSWVGGGSGTIVASGGWNVRDHRGPGSPTWTPTAENTRIPALHESAWRFMKQNDFGKKIRPNLVKTPLENLRITKATTRPPMRGQMRGVPTASIMQSRLQLKQQRARQASQRSGPIGPRTPGTSVGAPVGVPGRGPRGDRPAYGDTLSPTRDRSPVERMWPRGPSRPSPTYGGSGGRGAPSVRDDGRRYDPPSRTVPTGPRGDDRFTPPSRPLPEGPRGGDRVAPPSRPMPPPPPRGGDDRWSAPSRSSPPSRGNDDRGSSYSPPSRSDDRGSSRGSSSSGGNWSPPSRGSSSSGLSGGSYSPSRGSSGSSGSSSGSFGGGGGRGGSSSGGGGGGRRGR